MELDKDQLLQVLARKLKCEKRDVSFLFGRRPSANVSADNSDDKLEDENRDLEIPPQR